MPAESIDVLQQLDASLISSILTKTASELLKSAIKAEDAREKSQEAAEAEEGGAVEEPIQDNSHLEILLKIANCSGGKDGNGLSVRILRAKLIASRRADCTDWELPAVNLQSQIVFMVMEKFMHRKQPDAFGRLLYLVCTLLLHII